jgi:phosphoribosylformimino-5-aminoimidazole carboxamide ribotide isomerase
VEAVIIFPAIDLKEGQAVRLQQGDMARATVFNADPAAQAKAFEDQGFEYLHIVDLDGAFAGAPRQTAIVAAMMSAIAPVPVAVGGGLRDVAAVDAVVDAGARWAVVGTRAALDPAFLKDVCRHHPDRIIVAVDARGDRVAVKCWTEVIAETVIELGVRARDAGAAALLYTDVTRDGMEQGPNVEYTAALAAKVAMPVLASGGVSSVGDLVTLAAIPGVEGTVVGRALYTGAVGLADAMRAVAARAGRAGA